MGPTELAELAVTTGEGELAVTTRCDGGREIRATVAGPSCPVPKRAATGGTARCEAGGWLWWPTVGWDALPTAMRGVMGLKLMGGRSGALATDPLTKGGVATGTVGLGTVWTTGGMSDGFESLGILLGGCWFGAATRFWGLEAIDGGRTASSLRLAAAGGGSGFLAASRTGGVALGSAGPGLGSDEGAASGFFSGDGVTAGSSFPAPTTGLAFSSCSLCTLAG